MRTVEVTVEQLDGLVTWTLIRAAHHVERTLTDLFAGFDLSPTQFGVMAHVATGEQLTQADLARAVLVRPQSMAELISGLVERGLLVRTGHRGRGRANPIALSDEGANLLAQVWPAVQAANDLSSVGLTSTQTAELNALLHAVLNGGTSAAPGTTSTTGGSRGRQAPK